MKRALGEIAEIKSGMHFRSRVEYSDSGNVAVIQLRDVDEEGQVQFEKLSKIEISDVEKIDTLTKGDVILKAKSNKKTAALIADDLVDPTVATVHYFLIRSNAAIVLPEYMAWFLNNKTAQIYFKQHAEGSAARSLSIVKKSVLEKLEIDVPGMETQKKVVEIYKLCGEERKIEAELRDKRDAYIEEKLLSCVAQ